MADAVIGAGFSVITYGVLDTNGYIQGNTVDGATAGSATGEGMKYLEGAQTVPVQLNDDERVTPIWNDKPQKAFVFSASELPNGVMEMGLYNPEFASLVEGKLAYEGAIGTEVGSGVAGDRPDMAFMFQREARIYGDSGEALGRWEILMALNTTVTDLGTEVTQRAVNPYRFGITFGTNSRKLYGATFTTLQDGVTEQVLLRVTNQYPLHVVAFKEDAVVTSWTLPFAPISDAQLLVTRNGVVQTLTTDYTYSGTTLDTSAAGVGSSGDWIHVYMGISLNNLRTLF